LAESGRSRAVAHVLEEERPPSPDAKPAPVGQAEGATAGAESESRASNERELDTAIDTVVAMLRAFGEHAFDTDNVALTLDATYALPDAHCWGGWLPLAPSRARLCACQAKAASWA
jgi:hypothetical protein